LTAFVVVLWIESLQEISTGKGYPEPLGAFEDERQKSKNALPRTEEEAARIQTLHHGHHRTAKQRKLELPFPVKAVGKARKTVATPRSKPRAARNTARWCDPEVVLAGRTWGRYGRIASSGLLS